jgi:hypothetical protein
MQSTVASIDRIDHLARKAPARGQINTIARACVTGTMSSVVPSDIAQRDEHRSLIYSRNVIDDASQCVTARFGGKVGCNPEGSPPRMHIPQQSTHARADQIT